MTKRLKFSLAAVSLALAAGATLASAVSPQLVSDVASSVWRGARAAGADGQAAAQSTSFQEGVFVTTLSNVPVVAALADPATGNGLIAWSNNLGVTNNTGVKGAMGISPSNSGWISVRNSSNSIAFTLDGNTGLQSGPGDLAEAFPATVGAIEPGTVMAIDPEQHGALAVANRPYDRRVAGVVAGANDYRPGITLRGLAELPNKVALTLSGTVYCKVTRENGPVHAGDLLTTSSTPGHAMRATDRQASHGAILGKAMEDLEAEAGLILVLASLQ